MPSQKVDEIFARELEKLLKPERKIAYQALAILPKFDELSLKGARTLLVVKPDGRMPPHELTNFFQQLIEKNNLLVLTGEDSRLADSAEKRLREYYAINELCHRFKEGDTNYQEAKDRLEKAKSGFFQALSSAYDRLYYPAQCLDDEGESFVLPMQEDAALIKIIFHGGIKIGERNGETAEEQIEKVLSSSEANYKLYTEIKEDCTDLINLAERDLWYSHERKMPWSAVLSKAKSEVKFPWLPGLNGMERLKEKAIDKGKWRFDGNYIEKGPFPKEKATLNVQQENVNPETGEVFLRITPIFAGETPVIYYAPTPDVSNKSPVLEEYERFATQEGTLYFLVVDPTGHFESAAPVCWKADIELRHQVEVIAETRVVTLQATPRAEIFYSLDGTNPKDGIRYTEPFSIDNERHPLQVFARAGEASKQKNFEIPHRHDSKVHLDETQPARFTKRISLDSQEKIFAVCDKFRDKKENFFCGGSRVELGEGEETISVRFGGGRSVTFEEMERVSKALRDIFDPDRQARLLIESKEIRFETGHDLKTFAELVETELRSTDVEPENA